MVPLKPLAPGGIEGAPFSRPPLAGEVGLFLGPRTFPLSENSGSRLNVLLEVSNQEES